MLRFPRQTYHWKVATQPGTTFHAAECHHVTEFINGVSTEVMPLLGLLIKLCGALQIPLFLLGWKITSRELKMAKPP